MIPDELKQHRQWVNWKTIVRRGKQTKIPIQPNGMSAKSTDPNTWCDFSELADREIGFVFTQADPYIGIDLDGCRNPETGKLDDWAREIVLRFGSYAEISPSKTGVKIFGIADSVWRNKNKTELPGNGYLGKKPGIEVYDCGRYFAVTGRNLSGLNQLVNVDDSLEWLAEKFSMAATMFGIDGTDIPAETPLLERASRYLSKMDPSVSGQRGHDKCFKAACALVLGFSLTTDDAFALLAKEFNPRCQPAWSERELRHKVDSAAKQPGQRGYLADAVPNEWSKIFVRTGDAPRLDDEPASENAITRTLLSDAAFDHLQKVVNGEEVLFETGIPELDYAIGGGFASGEMVVVAARPSHGKSAIALQMVHHFTQKHPAIVVSEEMSALALGKRAIQYATDVPHEHWKTRSVDVLSDLDTHFGKRKETYIIEDCREVSRVSEEIHRLVEETSAKLIAVDYVQLLSARGKSRYEIVTAASQELRRLASSLDIILVVLAQLSREIENRKTFVPIMRDLKESGQIEQDADVIVFGVWPHKIDASHEREKYQFYIGKNRNRGTNMPSFNVKFEPHRQRLVEESAAIVYRPHPEFAEYA